MEFATNKRKIERRKKKRLLGKVRRYQDIKYSRIILKDSLIWLLCVGIAITILVIMLLLSY